MKGPYSAYSQEVGPLRTPVHGVSGPGEGLGCMAWLGWPQNTLPTAEAAEQAARLMNLAFDQGQKHQARAIKALLDV